MNLNENMKTLMISIFKRKGCNGSYVRIFDELALSCQNKIIENIVLLEDELPVIGGYKNHDKWFCITTCRIVWVNVGKINMIYLNTIYNVDIDVVSLKGKIVKKSEIQELRIYTRDKELYVFEAEKGPPLSGIWNVLRTISVRNSHNDDKDPL